MSSNKTPQISDKKNTTDNSFKKNGTYNNSNGYKKQNDDSNFKKNIKTSKTLYIGSQLIDERFKGLRRVLQSLGPVEQISEGIQNGNFILVTYESHEAAEKVLKTLKSKHETERLMFELENYFVEQKLPKSVVPDLGRYRYDWSDKPIPKKTSKNAFVQKSFQKDVVATTTTTTTPTTNGKEEKKEKKKVEKKEEDKKEKKKVEKKKEGEKKENGQTTTTTTTTPTVQTAPQATNNTSTTTTTVEKKQEKKKVDAEQLRGQAEKARLKDELSYLETQQKQVQQEILQERERCKTREERIGKLSEELARVDLQKQRLERQLSAEQHWQNAADDRISKLEEELQHMIQEYKGAELQFKNTTILGKWSDEIEN